MNPLLVRAGETAHGSVAVDVTPERAGWTFCGLQVVELSAGHSHAIATGPNEVLVLPLAGSCAVTVEGVAHELAGRPDVFTEVTDYLYLPRDTVATLTSAAGGRFAIPSARASRRLEVSYRPASDVVVTLRGAGSASRQVNNYALGNDLETDHLLVCEVLTPGGNWSSYPPHKHDEHSATERALEEIYLFEIRPGPAGPGFAFHRTYARGEHPLDLSEEVRTGDVVLTPHGYHGPSMAAPGYDLYYLNVMAGPAQDGQWLMTDDPAHHWIRETWDSQAVDPRLPMTAPVAAPSSKDPQ
ncbi:5-deoxy-glucuronate isomerase [Pengzhenrongella sicca]|uniref:5-deoxy-glucuronate isomerase n=1 Tax=Pengzhenrongella sicca TaxID=2819238 RepID=A0A8A4ZGG9_9MICO|nr:5-deoxy-glucuronate isomerase [Pengzhenrongella sicca]QTE30089.1 5-deoxy-glucuronate isomerase [Pengzhenrongella sicca]